MLGRPERPFGADPDDPAGFDLGDGETGVGAAKVGRDDLGHAERPAGHGIVGERLIQALLAAAGGSARLYPCGNRLQRAA